MNWSIAFFVIGAIGWIVAFFGYIRPKWLMFRQVMGIAEQAKVVTLMDAPDKPSLWRRIELRIRGLKGTILAFFTWAVVATTQLLDALDPVTLAPIKDSTVWQGIGGQEFALRVVSIVTLLIAFLSIRGQLHAARVVPNPPPPPPMNR